MGAVCWTRAAPATWARVNLPLKMLKPYETPTALRLIRNVSVDQSPRFRAVVPDLVNQSPWNGAGLPESLPSPEPARRGLMSEAEWVCMDSCSAWEGVDEETRCEKVPGNRTVC